MSKTPFRTLRFLLWDWKWIGNWTSSLLQPFLTFTPVCFCGAGLPLCDAQRHCGLQEKSQPWLGNTIRLGSGPCQTASRRGRFQFCPLCLLVNPLCPLCSTLISVTCIRNSLYSFQTTCPSDYLLYKLIVFLPLWSDENHSVVKKITSSKTFK